MVTGFAGVYCGLFNMVTGEVLLNIRKVTKSDKAPDVICDEEIEVHATTKGMYEPMPAGVVAAAEGMQMQMQQMGQQMV